MEYPPPIEKKRIYRMGELVCLGRSFQRPGFNVGVVVGHSGGHLYQVLKIHWVGTGVTEIISERWVTRIGEPQENTFLQGADIVEENEDTLTP
jgi:hypothetical protein